MLENGRFPLYPIY